MQDNMTAAAIALAFNTQNMRKVWSARANSRDNMERVHFTTETGMVKLTYDVRENTFRVDFMKVHAAWGDYVRAAARALHVVLTTLKSAGLPFDAPDDDEGVTIRTTTGAEGAITVAYEAPPTVASAIMPEQFKAERSIAMSAALGAAYSPERKPDGAPLDMYQMVAQTINEALTPPTTTKEYTDIHGYPDNPE